MGLVWASRFDIKYILKTDDDVYGRIPRILEYLVNATFPKPFCGGAAGRNFTKVFTKLVTNGQLVGNTIAKHSIQDIILVHFILYPAISSIDYLTMSI
jgi:hypothetical protein